MYHRNILVEQTDPELFAAIQAENARQEQHIELIASENYASPAVMAAQGSQLTNKYAEGYPGKRYYGGCEHVDVAEQLAIDRVKQIFGADAANATLTFLLRRMIRDHLRRSRPEKILNVFRRTRLRFFRACGLVSGRISFASSRTAMSDRLLAGV